MHSDLCKVYPVPVGKHCQDHYDYDRKNKIQSWSLTLSFEFQGKGYGSQMLNFVESLAQTAQIFTVSCRTELISFYTHRGYTEVKRVPVEEYIPAQYLTRSGLKMVIMKKDAKSKLTYKKIRNSTKVTFV